MQHDAIGRLLAVSDGNEVQTFEISDQRHPYTATRSHLGNSESKRFLDGTTADVVAKRQNVSTTEPIDNSRFEESTWKVIEASWNHQVPYAKTTSAPSSKGIYQLGKKAGDASIGQSSTSLEHR
jgi:hypothetical protein